MRPGREYRDERRMEAKLLPAPTTEERYLKEGGREGREWKGGV